MTRDWSVDSRLVEMAAKSEQVMVTQGLTDDGLPVLLIVAVGANVGLLKAKLLENNVLTGLEDLTK